MSKRSRGDTLTGGTKDVNPQTMIIVGATTTNGITAYTQALPIPRLPVKQGKSIVMEMLHVQFRHTGVASVAGATTLYTFAVTTNPTVPATLQALQVDPRVVAARGFMVLTDAAPTARLVVDLEIDEDLTDQAGHGILVATDNIYFLAAATNNAGAVLTNPSVTITYRFKEVALTEYIGIVQSQQ